MIKSFHVATPCMSTPHCPAQTPTLRCRMGRLIQSLFQDDLIKHQDGCKQSSQHDDLAPGHEETNRRPQPDTWLMLVTPRRALGLIFPAGFLSLFSLAFFI